MRTANIVAVIILISAASIRAMAACPTVEEETISICRAKAACGGNRGIMLSMFDQGKSFDRCLDRMLQIQKDDVQRAEAMRSLEIFNAKLDAEKAVLRAQEATIRTHNQINNP